MRKLLALFSIAALCLTARAQTNQTVIGGLGSIASAIGSDMPTNLALYTFGLYAKDAPKGHQWGGGAFLAWNFTQNVGAGMGIEAVGNQFFMPSAQIQLKLPMHPLTFLGWTNFTLTPYADAGAAAPLGGGSAGASTVASIAGAGAYIDLVSFLGGEFGIAGGYNYWGGAGVYSGDHYHGGLIWHKGF